MDRAKCQERDEFESAACYTRQRLTKALSRSRCRFQAVQLCAKAQGTYNDMCTFSTLLRVCTKQLQTVYHRNSGWRFAIKLFLLCYCFL